MIMWKVPSRRTLAFRVDRGRERCVMMTSLTHTYTHAHIHTHADTHTHIYIHTHTLSSPIISSSTFSSFHLPSYLIIYSVLSSHLITYSVIISSPILSPHHTREQMQEDRKREEEKQFVASTLERFEARMQATDQAIKQVRGWPIQTI